MMRRAPGWQKTEVRGRARDGKGKSVKDLHWRKRIQGISSDMHVVVDDERYWKNLNWLVERYKEVTGTKKNDFVSSYGGE
jgi:hypothetical protein